MRGIAAYHDVTLLCAPGMPGRERNVYREEIEAWIKENGPVQGLTIRYVAHPWWSYLTQRERESFRRTVYYGGYACWQWAAYRTALSLHAEQPFDIAHHLNMLGYREPGFLWKLPIPFAWGPIGGAANIPSAYFPLMSLRDRAFYAVRNAVNELQKRTRLRCRRAARKASRIWVIGEENRQLVAEVWGRHALPLLESGTSPRQGARVKVREPGSPLRLVWSGIHIGRKCLPILLHALARLGADADQVEVTILGEGPETRRWKALAARLGVAGRLRWTGQIPQPQAVAVMADAHALAFTSLQEATSLVVTEALSVGLPVICHDACGMRVAVSDEAGVKVPMGCPQVSIAGFASAIKRLNDDPAELTRLSQGALRRAEALSWDSISRAIAFGYAEVLQ